MMRNTMNWTSTIAMGLVCFVVSACSSRESHAAPSPKTVGKLPDESRPTTTPPPPAPDANAASRKPVEPSLPGETKSPGEPATALEPQPAQRPQTTPTQLEAPPVAPSSQAEDQLLSDEDAAIPTQEEADQEAALSITEENADEELEKLEKELAEGGGG